MIKNQKTGGLTKHTDVRHFFCREMHEKKLLSTWWVRTEENMVDGMAKNQSASWEGNRLTLRRASVELALLGLVEDSFD